MTKRNGVLVKDGGKTRNTVGESIGIPAARKQTAPLVPQPCPSAGDAAHTRTLLQHRCSLVAVDGGGALMTDDPSLTVDGARPQADAQP